MWDGPYGEWGSRKYLLSSLDQSLKRLGLDTVDIFYSHRFDPNHRHRDIERGRRVALELCQPFQNPPIQIRAHGFDGGSIVG